MSKPNVKDFIRWAVSHAQGQADPWGYILGTSGVMCTEALIQAKRRNYSSWSTSSYLSAARKWLGKMVADCQGLADYYYTHIVGVKTEITSNTNYTMWCKGHSSKNMGICPMEEGVALFRMHSNGRVHHVGWLCRVNGSWYVVEAKGLKYGVVLTPWKAAEWDAWGRMLAKFNYDGEGEGEMIAYGQESNEVKAYQQLLVDAGYKLPKYGVDGDWGPETQAAHNAFQTDHGVDKSSVVDIATQVAIFGLIGKDDQNDELIAALQTKIENAQKALA